jgi:hypothetical protein
MNDLLQFYAGLFGFIALVFLFTFVVAIIVRSISNARTVAVQVATVLNQCMG